MNITHLQNYTSISNILLIFQYKNRKLHQIFYAQDEKDVSILISPFQITFVATMRGCV